MSLSLRERNLLDAELESWVGTPYASGSIARGRGVDCRYFVVGVLDRLYRTTAPIPARVPPDTGMHNRIRALEIMCEIATRWPCLEIRGSPEIQSGDVIVIRAGGLASPTHCLIAGGDPRVLYHSTHPNGVIRTGRATITDKVVRTYRLLETDRW